MPTFKAMSLGKMIRYAFKYHPNKSVYKPHQGPKECARRIAQGKAGTCYVYGGQYHGG